MPWWIYILIAIAIILLLPYIRFLFKRITLCVKVKSFCKKENLIFHRTGIFWWLGVRKSGRCNFYIEAPKVVYSIKLIPTLKSKSCIHFFENRRYYIEKFLVLFGRWGSPALFSFKSKIRDMGELDFKYEFKKEWSAKRLVPILLINPSCNCVKLKGGNSEQIICDGDIVYESHIFGLKGLMTKITEQAFSSSEEEMQLKRADTQD